MNGWGSCHYSADRLSLMQPSSSMRTSRVYQWLSWVSPLSLTMQTKVIY